MALIYFYSNQLFCSVNHRDTQYLEAFGKNLKRVRESKGLSQEDLAAKADSVLSQVGRIERGKRAPTILTVQKLADALEVNVKELFNFSS